MRNANLHASLEAFTIDAAARLAAEVAAGSEIPFEIAQTEARRGRRPPLYRYRPLTEAFIRDHVADLEALPTYPPAARALSELDGVVCYLERRGASRLPADLDECVSAALQAFLSRVFEERSEFGFEPMRFEAAYEELEVAVYEGSSVTTVIAPLLGLALEHGSDELRLGGGISLLRGDLLGDAPEEAVWGEGDEPNVLAVLTAAQERPSQPALSLARAGFRRVLTALRLFERGGYALGPIAWSRTDTGPWRPVALGLSGRPRSVTFVSAEQEGELRAFCELTSRRVPGAGELAWALARFEMGCERLAPFEALTDYLLALRALLEPEGPASGRLAGRLAAICAEPDDRQRVAERVAHAISLERAAIAGLAPAEHSARGSRGWDEAHALVDELAEHLRALLRDTLCGHLEADLPRVADELLTDAPTLAPA